MADHGGIDDLHVQALCKLRRDRLSIALKTRPERRGPSHQDHSRRRIE